MTLSASERFEAAVETALECCEKGDSPLVASDYAAEQHSLEHRFDDLLERVREEVEDDQEEST